MAIGPRCGSSTFTAIPCPDQISEARAKRTKYQAVWRLTECGIAAVLTRSPAAREFRNDRLRRNFPQRHMALTNVIANIGRQLHETQQHHRANRGPRPYLPHLPQ